DLLAFHTTALGTAERRTRAEITAAYLNVGPEVLDSLLAQLDSLNLLSQPAGAADPTQRITRLAHDALAPLVREAFEKSDRPGQRARRIVETRIRDSAAQAAQAAQALPADSPERDQSLEKWIHKHSGSTALDALDYSTVLKGRAGMRDCQGPEA